MTKVVGGVVRPRSRRRPPLGGKTAWAWWVGPIPDRDRSARTGADAVGLQVFLLLGGGHRVGYLGCRPSKKRSVSGASCSEPHKPLTFPLGEGGCSMVAYRVCGPPVRVRVRWNRLQCRQAGAQGPGSG